MSQLKVNAIRHTGASSDAVTLASDGTCTAKITNNLSNRNLIIGGSMQIAQRGTSSTSNGYNTLDRWYTYVANTNNTVTTSQVAITSGGAYDAGFRKAAKMTLSGAGTLTTNTEILFYQKIEAQNLANSGWNYKSASSNITLSFWVKASTAQAYAAHIRTEDGTAYLYPFTYTVTQANVWQKITKTIPGNSNITIDDNNGSGLRVYVGVPAIGTDYDGATADTWVVSGSDKFPPIPSTWLTAGASTFEITGVQLEVGDVATDFEHRSYGDELLRCQRYFCRLSTRTDRNSSLGLGMYYGDVQIRLPVRSFVEMRSAPTVETTNSTDHFYAYAKGTGVGFPTFDSSHQEHKGGIVLGATIANNSNSGAGAYIVSYQDASTGVGVVSLNAEL